MPWRGRDAIYCKLCGAHRDDVGRLSARYKCPPCRESRMEENIVQLHLHNGPWFLHWRRRSAAALGAVLLDDL